MTLHLVPCPRCYGIECPCDERPDPLVTAAVEKRHRDARERALIRAGSQAMRGIERDQPNVVLGAPLVLARQAG